MPAFDTHRAALYDAVFAEFGTTGTRVNFPTSFPVALGRATADSDGVTYPVTTAIIYRKDAELAVNDRLTVGSENWQIAGILERDELATKYALRSVK